jgi:hypothetical protein
MEALKPTTVIGYPGMEHEYPANQGDLMTPLTRR